MIRFFFSRSSFYHRKYMLHFCFQVMAFISVLSAPAASYADSSVVPGNSGTGTANNSAAPQVTRIIQYPLSNNYYVSINGILYHVLGTPDHPEASFSVGKAPSFIQDGNVYVRDSSHQFYRRDPDGDHLVGTYVPGFESLDLRLQSPLQAADIDTFIAQNSPNSPLIGLGQVFIDAQTKYGVNAEYLAAHAILESGYGLSDIARDKHNLFGYQAYDDDAYGHAAYFPTFKDCIYFEAYFVRTQYLNANGQWYAGSPTLDGMNVHYASDPLWAEKISGIMNQIHPFDTHEYNQLQPLPVTAEKPAGPSTDPVQTIIKSTVPMTAAGVTADMVNFRESPSLDSTVYTVLAKGTKLTVIGKSSNWYEVTVGSQTGWIYKDYVDLQSTDSPTVSNKPVPAPAPAPAAPDTTKPVSNTPNGMTTDTVKFRSGPSLSASTYTVLQNGTQLTVLGYQQGWYNVCVGTQTGWVYQDYVKLNQVHSGPNVFINGTEQNYDQQPVIENGRILVPLRAIFESLGATVNWNQSTQTVIATKGQTKIVLQIGSNTAYVNGNSVPLDVQALTVHSRILVPARFVCDALGVVVSWDSKTNSVFIQA